jgi:glycosyltransferase involved in cell wall biosynthesis
MLLGFDGHVLTGKFQGTRTTLGNLLNALASHVDPGEIGVFCDDPAEARRNLGDSNPMIDRLQFVAMTTRSSLKRLLIDLPRQLKKIGAKYGVFNYIAPVQGSSIVFIHDILPITHPNFFPLVFRIRSAIWFYISVHRARLVVCVSDYSAQALLRNFGRGLAHKVRTIRNGPSFPVDVYFAPRPEARRRSILCVGRIEQRKNVHLLIEAFTQANVPDVELVIVGSYDQGFAYDFPDDPRIRRITGIDEPGLIALFREASLFVYPSAAEGFGLPLLDAVLFGIPTLASDRTAMPEVAGELAEYFDPTAAGAAQWLAGRIAGHFEDRPVVPPSLDARRVHAEMLSWDSAARALLQAVRELDRY